MIRIGTIGAGGRGRISKMAHKPEAGAALAMVCDTHAQVIQEYQDEYGSQLQVTDDWQKVVQNEELDAVFITTPDFLHEEQAIAALETGKTVYLEKPMAITLEGCDRILEASRNNGNRLYVGHNMRFFPVMQKMKELIDTGVIGEVQAIWCRHFVDFGGDAYFKDWHAEQRYATGLLLQKGAHDIDMIHWFGGGYTRRTVGMGKLSVYNRITDRRAPDEQTRGKNDLANWPPLSQKGMNPIIEVEDHSMMMMELDNGVQASYTQCHYTPDGYRNYTIIGTEGRIENHGDHSMDQHHAEIWLWTQRCGNVAGGGYQTIAVPPATGSHGGADPLIVDDFLDFVKTGQCQGAHPIDARMSVAAGLAATQSLREGNRPMDVMSLAQEADC